MNSTMQETRRAGRRGSPVTDPYCDAGTSHLTASRRSRRLPGQRDALAQLVLTEPPAQQIGGDGYMRGFCYCRAMGAEVQVDPAVLTRAQQACEKLAAEWAADEHDVEGATITAAQGVAGWVTQRALEDLRWYWDDDRAKLSSYLNTLGAALAHTADAYRVSDHASADLFDIRGR
jgi:hypothetical protein